MAEELLTKKIDSSQLFSLQKDQDSLFETPGSVYILSSEDIRRSGATNIPEALRLVPGMEVYRAGSGDWSISSRGFGRLYDNKILVMIDGREVHDSLFSGASWDTMDMVLEDVEKVEVIRGGSVSMWGENGINAIINVVTKKSEHTQGNHLSALVGDRENNVEFRNGGFFNENLFYRLYGKSTSRKEMKSVDYKRGNQFFGAGDDWQVNKFGFRADWSRTPSDEITFIGDVHKGTKDQILYIPSFEDTGIVDVEDFKGFNLNTKWERLHDSGSRSVFSFYIDDSRRRSLEYGVNRTILNFNYEHYANLTKSNKVKLGFNYRYNKDKFQSGVINGLTINEFKPDKDNASFYNGFVESTQNLIQDKLDIILGAKIENHYVTGSHISPAAKIRWKVNEDNLLWASYSKGVRTPSKFENNLRRLSDYYEQYDKYGYWSGSNWQNNKFREEKFKSYEIGYRNNYSPRINFDISTFYNLYDNVRTFNINLPKFQAEVENKSDARTYGFNSSVNFNLHKNWNLVLGYSYLDQDIDFDKDANDIFSIYDAGSSPHNQFQIQSRYNVSRDIDFDAYFFYVSGLDTVFVDSYKRLDLRVAWRPTQDVELSLVGQKLFYGDTRETTRVFYGTHNASYGNQLYFKINWGF